MLFARFDKNADGNLKLLDFLAIVEALQNTQCVETGLMQYMLLDPTTQYDLEKVKKSMLEFNQDGHDKRDGIELSRPETTSAAALARRVGF